MLKRAFACVVVVILATAVHAHDLFLKLDTYFLEPNSKAVVKVLNGTFTTSDGLVALTRFRNMSVVATSLSGPVNEMLSFRAEEKTTIMEVRTGEPGTYLVGLSTHPREITLNAAQFNEYLEHYGLPDTLAARQRESELDKDARERYSKHVRAIFQVGDKLTDDFKRPLNYPVEIIPQENPYSLRAGQTISLLCTFEGQPLSNQFVMAGWESAAGKLTKITARSDENGIVRFKLLGAGKWYVKFIHLTRLTNPKLDYESRWASTTFQIRPRGVAKPND